MTPGRDSWLRIAVALALGGVTVTAHAQQSAAEPPSLLDRPLETPPALAPGSGDAAVAPPGPTEHFVVPSDPPSGFTGRSGIAPGVFQADDDFVPVEDRWRLGFPPWDRYGKDHPLLDDYPYDEGDLLNPYNQSVLKGDYPIIGQHTFFELTASLTSLIEPRQIPTSARTFESTANPNQAEFFGSPNQLLNQQTVSVSLDLFHGDAAFKPVDWRIVLVPVFSVTNLNVSELGVVTTTWREGVQRERSFFALEQYFVEKKIADLSPNYDFVSVRVGSQPFNSDFRGFIFNDINRGVRIFGTLESNQDQFNLAYFNQLEKDTNTGLNTFNNRQQQILIGNFYRQDFIWPGLTVEGVIDYNHDDGGVKYNKNGFLVRPDPVGVPQPHEVDAIYFGLNADGHINRINIDSALYWVIGHDTHNPIANTPQDINAKMAAIEVSYDVDYVRFRSSFFFASGDGNPNNHHATGFDSILDNPNFAGTEFSYFMRQNIPLFGVNLKQRLSIIPDLRSSKIQGQSNFVNPGLELFNVGFDVDLTPKLKWVNNYNLLWFDKTAVLETFVFQGNIDRFIGADFSTGLEYRPLLSENVVMLFGFGTLLPGKGFSDLYARLDHQVEPPVSAFAEVKFLY